MAFAKNMCKSLKNRKFTILPISLLLLLSSCSEKVPTILEKEQGDTENVTQPKKVEVAVLEYKRGDFIWRPDEIELKIPDNSAWPQKLFVQATSKSLDEDRGWDGLLLELPPSWSLLSVDFDKLSIRITRDNGYIYSIPPQDLHKVGFNIHASDKTEEELISSWGLYKVKKTN